MKQYIYTLISSYQTFLQTVTFSTWLKSVFLFLWVFFIDVRFFFLGVYFFVVLDVLTGIVASRKQGKTIKSSLMKTGLLSKFVIYLLALLIVFFIDKAVMSLANVSIYYTFIATSLIIFLYEGFSILENCRVIWPTNTFLMKFARYFNIADNTVDKVIENASNRIIKVSGDKIDNTINNFGPDISHDISDIEPHHD